MLQRHISIFLISKKDTHLKPSGLCFSFTQWDINMAVMSAFSTVLSIHRGKDHELGSKELIFFYSWYGSSLNNSNDNACALSCCSWAVNHKKIGLKKKSFWREEYETNTPNTKPDKPLLAFPKDLTILLPWGRHLLYTASHMWQHHGTPSWQTTLSVISALM